MRGHTIETKSNQCHAPTNQRPQRLRALPRIHASSPAQPNEEKHHTGSEQKDTPKIKFFKLLALGFAFDVQLGVGWRMIEELVEHESDDREDDAEIIRPSPSCCSMKDERPGDDRTEYYYRSATKSRNHEGEERLIHTSKRHTAQENANHRRPSMFIRHQLSQNDPETQLSCGRQAIAQIGADEGVYGLSSAADDVADETEEGGSHDHPFASEDIGEPAHEEEADGDGEGPDGSDPVYIRTRPNIRVNKKSISVSFYPLLSISSLTVYSQVIPSPNKRKYLHSKSPIHLIISFISFPR
jgi:hypothetical protein